VEEITRPLSKYKESTITPSLEYRRILTLGETSQEKLYFLSIFFLSLSTMTYTCCCVTLIWDEWNDALSWVFIGVRNYYSNACVRCLLHTVT
jgi:hypothetical protein